MGSLIIILSGICIYLLISKGYIKIKDRINTIKKKKFNDRFNSFYSSFKDQL